VLYSLRFVVTQTIIIFSFATLIKFVGTEAVVFLFCQTLWQREDYVPPSFPLLKQAQFCIRTTFRKVFKNVYIRSEKDGSTLSSAETKRSNETMHL
jgi:hypothetical protein